MRVSSVPDPPETHILNSDATKRPPKSEAAWTEVHNVGEGTSEQRRACELRNGRRRPTTVSSSPSARSIAWKQQRIFRLEKLFACTTREPTNDFTDRPPEQAPLKIASTTLAPHVCYPVCEKGSQTPNERMHARWAQNRPTSLAVLALQMQRTHYSECHPHNVRKWQMRAGDASWTAAQSTWARQMPYPHVTHDNTISFYTEVGVPRGKASTL